MSFLVWACVSGLLWSSHLQLQSWQDQGLAEAIRRLEVAGDQADRLLSLQVAGLQVEEAAEAEVVTKRHQVLLVVDLGSDMLLQS